MTTTVHLLPDVQRKLEALASRNGQNIEVIANNLLRMAVESGYQNDTTAAGIVPPNEKALAALRRIAEMQLGMRNTDGSKTEGIIRNGRAGGMYDNHVAS